MKGRAEAAQDGAAGSVRSCRNYWLRPSHIEMPRYFLCGSEASQDANVTHIGKARLQPGCPPARRTVEWHVAEGAWQRRYGPGAAR